MKEILTQLLFAALTICSPLVTAYIHKAAAAIDASTAEKVKNETIQRVCHEITDAVANAVAAYAETLLPNRGGIGRYPVKAGRPAGWVHIDTRAVKSRWVG